MFPVILFKVHDFYSSDCKYYFIRSHHKCVYQMWLYSNSGLYRLERWSRLLIIAEFWVKLRGWGLKVKVSVNHSHESTRRGGPDPPQKLPKYFLVYTYLELFIFFLLCSFTNFVISREDLIITPAEDYIHIIVKRKKQNDAHSRGHFMIRINIPVKRFNFSCSPGLTLQEVSFPSSA